MGLRMDDLHAPTVGSGPTSSTYTNGTQAKQTLPQLIAEKDNLEAELSALSSVLDSHGVDMKTALTTFDGFPRSDIDVPQIRTTRARIIHLKTDHKALMVKLEKAVHEQFAAGKAPEDMPRNGVRPFVNGASTASSSAPVVEPPFARVNSVVEGSPAAESGLQAGDKIVSFGTVNWQNHERLGKVAQAVQQNENVSDKHGRPRSTVCMWLMCCVARHYGESHTCVRYGCVNGALSPFDTTAELGRPWTTWLSSSARLKSADATTLRMATWHAKHRMRRENVRG